MIGVDLQGPVEPAEGALREPVAGARRLGLRPVREEGRGVAEQRMGTPVRGDRLVEALLHHPRAGEEEPALGVGGVGRELRGQRVDHRFHVRRRSDAAGCVTRPGRPGCAARLRRRDAAGRHARSRRPRVERVRRAEPQIDREAAGRHREHDHGRHPVWCRARGGMRLRRLAGGRRIDVGEQPALQILTQRGVSVRFDLPQVVLPIQLREPRAVQRDVGVAGCAFAAGVVPAQQRRRQQQEHGHGHHQSQEPEQEHGKPRGRVPDGRVAPDAPGGRESIGRPMRRQGAEVARTATPGPGPAPAPGDPAPRRNAVIVRPGPYAGIIDSGITGERRSGAGRAARGARIDLRGPAGEVVRRTGRFIYTSADLQRTTATEGGPGRFAAQAGRAGSVT